LNATPAFASAALDEKIALFRSLHEGLGSTLMSTLVALERGAMPPADVLDVLRECVDDSRIVIDSLEPIGHDVVVLLATMRHRLGPRLQAAGLNVRWEVQDLPLLTWLGPSQALQVMRILQEALNNVLRHAQASIVRIATHEAVDAGGRARVVIEIEDNGVGFDPVVSHSGRGLSQLSARALQVAATVEIDSKRARGTRVTLTLPLSSANVLTGCCA
jgi:signal transduction histidine kinase